MWGGQNVSILGVFFRHTRKSSVSFDPAIVANVLNVLLYGHLCRHNISAHRINYFMSTYSGLYSLKHEGKKILRN